MSSSKAVVIVPGVDRIWGINGDLLIIYPKPDSIYLRGTIWLSENLGELPEVLSACLGEEGADVPQCNYLLYLVAQLKLGSPQVSRDPIFARVAVQKLYPFAGKVQMMPSRLDSHCSCLFRDPWAASLFLKHFCRHMILDMILCISKAVRATAP